MRRTRMVAVAGAVALATSTLGMTAASAQAPAGAQADGKARSYVVLADKGGDAKALAKQLAKAGAKDDGKLGPDRRVALDVVAGDADLGHVLAH